MLRPVGIVLVVAALVFGVAAPARTGVDADDAAANRLAAETESLVEQAKATESPGDRAALYERALETLDELDARHPYSFVASRLGVIYRFTIQKLRWLSLAEGCIAESDRLCVLDVALEISQADQTGDDRFSWALALISAGQADAGAFEQAHDTAHAISSLGDQAWALGAVARYLARAGKSAESQNVFREGVQAANIAKSALLRAWALASVAVWQADAGDKSGALHNVHRAMESANGLKDPWAQAWLLALLAEVRIKTGDAAEGRGALARAAAHAWNIVSPRHRFEAVSVVAWVQAETGDAAGARENVERALESVNSLELQFDSILSGWPRDEALSDIIAAQARTGDLEEAFKNAAGIDDPYWRARTLAICAWDQLEGDDVDGARRTVRSAFAVIEKLHIHLEIATTLAYLGFGIVAQ